MRINGKVYCLFEQSGTFKNEFLKLGIMAEDYDIQNQYGETDYQLDIFREIDAYYLKNANIFEHISQDDLVLAFFPCIYFCENNRLMFTGKHMLQRNLNDTQLLQNIINRANKRHGFYILLLKLFGIMIDRKIRFICENPYSTQSYLYCNIPYEPAIIEKNRQLRGDYYRKPTQYWFINCTPSNLTTKEKTKNLKIVGKVNGETKGGTCNRERSEMSPNYARNFILDNILGIPRTGTQLSKPCSE